MSVTNYDPTDGPPWAHRLYETLREHQVTQFGFVPDAGHKVLIARSLADPEVQAVPLTTEEEGVALCAGADLGDGRAVLLPAALPGIIGGVLLAASRAIGETMIVVMAAGLNANLTLNPIKAVTTVTVQIVTLLTGDQEFDSAKTLAAFALGLLLFVVTLILNLIALYVVRKYREQYE